MKILVTGDRLWGGWDASVGAFTLPFDVQRTYLAVSRFLPEDILVEGEARGADKLAREAAEDFGISVRPFPAHWDHWSSCPPDCNRVIGRAAGVLRNQEMLDKEAPDVVIWCHNNLKESKGTRDMVRRAMSARVPVFSIDDWLGA